VAISPKLLPVNPTKPTNCHTPFRFPSKGSAGERTQGCASQLDIRALVRPDSLPAGTRKVQPKCSAGASCLLTRRYLRCTSAARRQDELSELERQRRALVHKKVAETERSMANRLSRARRCPHQHDAVTQGGFEVGTRTLVLEDRLACASSPSFVELREDAW
jgi:hypothetical protein